MNFVMRMPTTVRNISGPFFAFIYFLAISIFLQEIIVVGLAQSGHLPENEKNVLAEIAYQLGKMDWDFSLNPCDNNSNWLTPQNPDRPWYNNSVVCNCSYPGKICHVEKIFLKGQDFSGVLPPSLEKLPHLKMIDFTRNYLSGTIPREWESTKLEYLSVAVNRLSGRMPSYLGNINTLVYMNLESNLFYGAVPAELGKLTNLANLVLSANNLTFVLPMHLKNLKKLTELRLSSNNFRGKIPSLESWTNLQKLELQASGFEGPIPSNISILKNLTELRISDLNGGASEFPWLKDMTNMTTLILRSCNISGKIPPYLTNFLSLKNLDLAFNRLEGELPNLGQLSKLESVLMTDNFLSGPIPQWVTTRPLRGGIDLSYNNFSKTSECEACWRTPNLFRSFGDRITADINECGRPCSKDYYSFHINCGGVATRIGGINFETDQESGGPAKFVRTGDNWGASSTGFFLGRNATTDEHGYLAQNVSVLRLNDSNLYTNARLSALSLTYYGRCLANGNYTVIIHFAEIVFRSNFSFQSLGRRMFDVYIQGKRRKKDFNIEQEAGGVDRVVKLNFTALVENGYLEIRFQYAGKGTTAVPSRGTYGPLVSAISVKSDFNPPPKSRKKIFITTVAGILGLFLILAATSYWWWNRYIQRRISREKELRGLDLRIGFTYTQIKAATDNFAPANKIGEGGFGSVYKGTLLDGTTIAVKKLSSQSKQGNREFINEIGMISGLQHPNLVKLYGCCIEGSQLVLVYEYMDNNSLARALFGPDECQLEIDWHTRQKICVGIAKGLNYLHEESTLKIVHRDIKANNVLLDKDLNPKISDFGLAKLGDDENTHISTRVAGTIGYMAPEYALWGYLTHKADVYSFGVVTLEIVAGKNNVRYRPNENFVCLLDWALVTQKRGSLMEIVDPRLASNFDANEAEKIIRIALLCTSPSPGLRPCMSEVVEMLEGHISIQEFNMNPSIYNSELQLQVLREKYDGDLYLDLSETQPLC